MGVPAPANVVGSPVSQANEQQACTAQALHEISTAADLRQASMTQEMQQLPAYNEQAEAQRSCQEATDLLSAALVNISNSSQLPQLCIGGAENLMVGAVMAPMVKQLAEAHRIQRRSDLLSQKAAQIIGRSESFQALLAAAMVTQSQQIHGLARYQAVSVRARLASGQTDLGGPKLKQPLTSPVRRQVNRETEPRRGHTSKLKTCSSA